MFHPMNRDLLVALIYNLPIGPYRMNDCILIDGHYYGKCFDLLYYVDGIQIRLHQLQVALEACDISHIKIPPPHLLGYDLLAKTMTASYLECFEDHEHHEEFLEYQRIQNYVHNVAYPAYLQWMHEFLRVPEKPEETAVSDLVSLRGGVGNSLELVVNGVKVGVEMAKGALDVSVDKAKEWMGMRSA